MEKEKGRQRRNKEPSIGTYLIKVLEQSQFILHEDFELMGERMKNMPSLPWSTFNKPNQPISYLMKEQIRDLAAESLNRQASIAFGKDQLRGFQKGILNSYLRLITEHTDLGLSVDDFPMDNLEVVASKARTYRQAIEIYDEPFCIYDRTDYSNPGRRSLLYVEHLANKIHFDVPGFAIDKDHDLGVLRYLVETYANGYMNRPPFANTATLRTKGIIKSEHHHITTKARQELSSL